ncbi:MAG TPA: hypothetical protein VMO80_06925 [Terriglobales bacterium]|jgi:hypothetical protein|nr:hypothetical protein [Terriglobales bacterium]
MASVRKTTATLAPREITSDDVLNELQRLERDEGQHLTMLDGRDSGNDQAKTS